MNFLSLFVLIPLVMLLGLWLAKVPVKTITAESNNMATEMPSTPTEYLM